MEHRDRTAQMTKVFLGGTCNGSTWRDLLIPQLEIDYFNPVVEDWTPDCLGEEFRQKEVCDYLLYVITPKMSGAYSIAEVVDDSNKRPEKTILCILLDDGEGQFTAGQLKSLSAVAGMVSGNGAMTGSSLEDVARILNS